MSEMNTGTDGDARGDCTMIWPGQITKLFYCRAHNEMNDSFCVYVRADTYEEAAKGLIEYWMADGVIEDSDDIDEEAIEVFEVPSVEGRRGAVDWGEIEFISVEKYGLI